MAPDNKKGKQGPVSGETVAQLRAFEATYKAACKRHTAILHKPLLLELQEHLEAGTPCNKVILTGDTVNAASLRVVMDCLAGYPSVQNFCCWSCNVGDEGLLALCALLKASCDKWWKGSKLRLVEITNDGFTGSRHSPCSTTSQAHTVTHASQPPAVTAASSTQQSFSSRPRTAGASSLRQASQTCTRPSTATQATSTGRPSPALQESDTLEEPWHIPAGTFGAPEGLLDRQSAHCFATGSNQLTLTQQQLHDRSQPLTGRAGSLRTSLELRSSMMLGTMREWSKHQQEQQLPVQQPWDSQLSHQQQHDSGQRQQQQQQQQQARMQKQQMQAPQQRSLTAASSQREPQQQQPMEQQQQLTPPYSQLSQTACSELQPSAANTNNHAVELLASTRPRFGIAALQQLSLTLGAQGLALQVLCLDDCQLGDQGFDRMAGGLARCTSLRCLSLQRCGLGTLAAPVIAAALPPQLASLRLSGNALCGQGLQALVFGLKEAAAGSTLKELRLADISVTEEDATPLQRLAYGLMDGICPVLQELDLDMNFIGDRSAAQFLSLLPRKPTLTMLHLTSRIDRGLMAQLKELLDANLAASKKSAGKGTKKKQKK